MKHSLYAIVCILSSLVCVQNARATDTHNNYMILGPGAYTCQRIVGDLTRDAAAKNPASVIVYSNWLAGDLTGYNRDTKGTYSILGSSSFTESFAWVVQYCQKHPTQIYASAAEALVAKLKPHRQASMAQPKDESDESDKDEGSKDEGSKDDNSKNDDNFKDDQQDDEEDGK